MFVREFVRVGDLVVVVHVAMQGVGSSFQLSIKAMQGLVRCGSSA